MTTFSPLEAASEGLRMMRREPKAVVYWIAVWALALAAIGVIKAWGAPAAAPGTARGAIGLVRSFGPLAVVLVPTLLALGVDANPEILLVLLFLYSLAIPADSGALTSGMSASAHPDYRGATMALHSTVGFGLSAAGGWAVGAALDVGGGMTSTTGWFLAFVVMAAGGLMGSIALWSSMCPTSNLTVKVR